MTGAILWLTGLSGAGKTTLAHAVAARVRDLRDLEILDGDVVRQELSKGLGYTREDRDTNIRRIGFVARLLGRHGVLVIVAAISPYAAVRDEVRAQAQAEGTVFLEVFVNPTLDALVARDVKGLYRRALAGEIAHFTGVSDPYEPPSQADLVIATDTEAVDVSAARLVALLAERGVVPPQPA